MNAIALPANNRPELLAQFLGSLSHCAGVEDWALVASCEPHATVIGLLEKFTACPVCVFRNAVQMGCRANTFLAALSAHRIGANFTLYVEDDLTLSRDALTLAGQFRRSGKPGVVALRRWAKTEDVSRPDDVTPACHGLLGDGFGWHRETWPLLQRFWFWFGDGVGGDMWDWSVSWGLDQHRVQQWRPLVQRSTNHGTNGTHSNQASDPNRCTPCYTGNTPRFNFIG